MVGHHFDETSAWATASSNPANYVSSAANAVIDPTGGYETLFSGNGVYINHHHMANAMTYSSGMYFYKKNVSVHPSYDGIAAKMRLCASARTHSVVC